MYLHFSNVCDKVHTRVPGKRNKTPRAGETKNANRVRYEQAAAVVVRRTYEASCCEMDGCVTFLPGVGKKARSASCGRLSKTTASLTSRAMTSLGLVERLIYVMQSSWRPQESARHAARCLTLSLITETPTLECLVVPASAAASSDTALMRYSLFPG